MYRRMVLMVVCWRYGMPSEANDCVSTLMNVDWIKWTYFCINEFEVGVTDTIFSGNIFWSSKRCVWLLVLSFNAVFVLWGSYLIYLLYFSDYFLFFCPYSFTYLLGSLGKRFKYVISSLLLLKSLSKYLNLCFQVNSEIFPPKPTGLYGGLRLCLN